MLYAWTLYQKRGSPHPSLPSFPPVQIKPSILIRLFFAAGEALEGGFDDLADLAGVAFLGEFLNGGFGGEKAEVSVDAVSQ